VSRLALALALAAFATFATPARAAHIDLAASDLGGGSVAETDLGPGFLAFDPAFPAFAPMTLAIVFDAGEAGAPIAWNALVDNLTGELWRAFSIRLVGATFAGIGSASGNSAAVDTVVTSAAEALIRFGDPGEAAGIDVGAALGSGTDWQIAGAGAGFTMVLQPVAVPEPGTAALLAIGLAGLAARRVRERSEER
jgi:hypothetical protein